MYIFDIHIFMESSRIMFGSKYKENNKYNHIHFVINLKHIFRLQSAKEFPQGKLFLFKQEHRRSNSTQQHPCTLSTCSSLFICFWKQKLLMADINHVIHFSQSQLLLSKMNQIRTACRKFPLVFDCIGFCCSLS